jgi:integrase
MQDEAAWPMSRLLTSDNFHLSRPTTTDFGCADDGTPLSVLNCSDPKILEFIAAATAENTRRAYNADLRHFLAWGGHLPATPEQVARYLADHAASLSTATLARRLAGVRAAHVKRGFRDPTKGDLVRLTFRGIRRRFGRPQRRVAALSGDDLSTIVASLGQSTKEIRDGAILLIGFAGAFRRSELAAIDCKDVDTYSSGIVITIPHSKTDQGHRGRKAVIPRGQAPLCPVAALECWLTVSGITDGPLFKRVTTGGRVLAGRISAEAIALVVKQRLWAIGRDALRYSGHSIRSGFATAAAAAGVPSWKIMAQTGHASYAALERYIREEAVFASSAAVFK